MSAISWIFKSKKAMAEKNTKYVKIGSYHITSHAQNRFAEPTRKLKKWHVLENLFTKPIILTEIKVDDFKRKSYKRIGKRITTAINPDNNYVISLWPISKSKRKRYNLKKGVI